MSLRWASNQRGNHCQQDQNRGIPTLKRMPTSPNTLTHTCWLAIILCPLIPVPIKPRQQLLWLPLLVLGKLHCSRQDTAAEAVLSNVDTSTDHWCRGGICSAERIEQHRRRSSVTALMPRDQAAALQTDGRNEGRLAVGAGWGRGNREGGTVQSAPAASCLLYFYQPCTRQQLLILVLQV